MKGKQHLRLVLYPIFIGAAIIFFAYEKPILGIGFLVVCYLLFGFIGLVFLFNMFGAKPVGNLLLRLTLPLFLLKMEKTYYYWLKSSLVAEKKMTSGKRSNWRKELNWRTWGVTMTGVCSISFYPVYTMIYMSLTSSYTI